MIALDRAARALITADGHEYRADGVVLATGVWPRAC